MKDTKTAQYQYKLVAESLKQYMELIKRSALYNSFYLIQFIESLKWS